MFITLFFYFLLFTALTSFVCMADNSQKKERDHTRDNTIAKVETFSVAGLNHINFDVFYISLWDHKKEVM